MLKEISKRTMFAFSLLASAVSGFLFLGGRGATTDESESLLIEPIFSIETAHADGGGGDCCCSSCDTFLLPTAAAWVYISIDSY